MDSKLELSLRAKSELLREDILNSLDDSIREMAANHARDGKLGSGDTIAKTMEFIRESDQEFYHEMHEHLVSLPFRYDELLLAQLLQLIDDIHIQLAEELKKRLKKSAELARAENLYERMLPEVENTLELEAKFFANAVEVYLHNLAASGTDSASRQVFWASELVLIAICIFLAGMWFKDPTGNYEPIILGLGFVVSLLAVDYRVAYAKK
ncbi:MAG: hypothetical protein HOC70_04410 [Gammaproteobacteria bacterium]|nr:hypothetical protein [Gammaproteobacteria bacterium]